MDEAVKRFPPPSVLRYPLLADTGRYEPSVPTGTRVRAGDALACGGLGSAGSYLHAGASGVVEVGATAMLLHPDGREDVAPPLTANDLVQTVREAGIVGMGGAGYPTWLKLQQARQSEVRTLIVNAVECEPGVSADAALLREHADEVLSGIEALADYLGNPRRIIALGEGMDAPHSSPMEQPPPVAGASGGDHSMEVPHDRRLTAPNVFLRGRVPSRAPGPAQHADH